MSKISLDINKQLQDLTTIRDDQNKKIIQQNTSILGLLNVNNNLQQTIIELNQQNIAIQNQNTQLLNSILEKPTILEAENLRTLEVGLEQFGISVPSNIDITPEIIINAENNRYYKFLGWVYTSGQAALTGGADFTGPEIDAIQILADAGVKVDITILSYLKYTVFSTAFTKGDTDPESVIVQWSKGGQQIASMRAVPIIANIWERDTNDPNPIIKKGDKIQEIITNNWEEDIVVYGEKNFKTYNEIPLDELKWYIDNIKKVFK